MNTFIICMVWTKGNKKQKGIKIGTENEISVPIDSIAGFQMNKVIKIHYTLVFFMLHLV